MKKEEIEEYENKFLSMLKIYKGVHNKENLSFIKLSYMQKEYPTSNIEDFENAARCLENKGIIKSGEEERKSSTEDSETYLFWLL